MFTLLKSLYQNAEEIKGKKLVYLLVAIFVFFALFGITVGYITDRFLTLNDTGNSQEGTVEDPGRELSYEGKIRYIDPQLYPGEEISFTLVDKTGKEIILLKSNDKILVVSENQYATVYGSSTRTSGGKEVLLVERVKISNVSN
jgi:hypothetical protein